MGQNGKRYRAEEIVMKSRGIELSMNMGRLEFLSKVIITKVNITSDTLENSGVVKSQQLL